jgi:hypothetical protein
MRSLPDMFFGSIALKNKMLTREQLAAALREQVARAQAGRGATLGEVCRDLGLLSLESVNAILWAQAKSEVMLEDTLLGRIAVRNNILTEAGLRGALAEQARRGPRARLGAILVESGALSAEDLGALLKAQRRLQESRRLKPVIVPPAKPTIVPPPKPPAPKPTAERRGRAKRPKKKG